MINLSHQSGPAIQAWIALMENTQWSECITDSYLMLTAKFTQASALSLQKPVQTQTDIVELNPNVIFGKYNVWNRFELRDDEV